MNTHAVRKSEVRPCLDTVALTTFGLVGSAVGIATYWGYVILFDKFIMPSLVAPGTPMLSYGQQFTFIMTPLAALLGAGIGTSIILTRWRGQLVASAVTAAVPILVGVLVAGQWQSNFARYGADPTDLLLFVPLLVGSALCLCWTVLLAIAGGARWIEKTVNW